MKIAGILWLRDYVEKLAVKHGVARSEVEEVFASRPSTRFVEKGHYPDEDVYSAHGQTDAGRYLTVFFVYKSDKRALIVSARNMTKAERRRYGRK
ncbi:MAG: BrnT family toxin [Chloroflexi bacterium]|nr:BrnT family toxin [Chloroflexota bacterium]